jgi:DNA-binding transcriptional regulator GbsR (MarR family)
MCYDNGIPRSGAKYELRSRLIDHAKEAIRKREENTLRETDDLGAKYELEVRKFKSFEAAFNHAKKVLEKIGTNSEFSYTFPTTLCVVISLYVGCRMF